MTEGQLEVLKELAKKDPRYQKYVDRALSSGASSPVRVVKPLPVLCSNLGKTVKRTGCNCPHKDTYVCNKEHGNVRPVTDCGPDCGDYSADPDPT